MAAPKGTRPPAAGMGRKVGSVNKYTASIKDAFRLAFDAIGGTDALAAWARENPTDFYKLAARLIPVEIQGKVTHAVTAKEMDDDSLAAIAAGSGVRATGSPSRPQLPN